LINSWGSQICLEEIKDTELNCIQLVMSVLVGEVERVWMSMVEQMSESGSLANWDLRAMLRR
jgi:hypothetical protein